MPFRRLYRGNLPLAACQLRLGKDSHKCLDAASRVFCRLAPTRPPGQTWTSHPASACSCLPSGGWNVSKKKMGEENTFMIKTSCRRQRFNSFRVLKDTDEKSTAPNLQLIKSVLKAAHLLAKAAPRDAANTQVSEETPGAGAVHLQQGSCFWDRLDANHPVNTFTGASKNTKT